MTTLPSALEKVIESLRLLPGVGPRTAERYAYYLLKSNPEKSKKLADSISQLQDEVSYCQKTFALVDKGQELSPLYTSSNRDKQTVAVVAEPFDILALEKTGTYKGTYHVLGGLISPIDGIGPDQLTIKQLVRRVEEDQVDEVILATNASVEGESTALYIQQQLNGTKSRLTRLARGLPIGVDLEYADQITLTRALEGRQNL